MTVQMFDFVDGDHQVWFSLHDDLPIDPQDDCSICIGSGDTQKAAKLAAIQFCLGAMRLVSDLKTTEAKP